jgi:sulfite exporter TauE/SafE
MIPSPLIWGLLLGLGSSLHCSGMCGPLGCSLLLMGGPDRSRQALLGRLAVMQLGRVTSYVALGLLFGVFGAGLQTRLDTTALHLAMQWAAGAAVVWLGLSTAGMVPSLAAVDHLTMPIARGLAGVRGKLSQGGPEVALLAGLVWGVTPCAMVYTALFNSLLTGNAADGVLLMAAFGLGTVPAVVLSTLALVGARSMAHRPGRKVAGALMIASGILALLLTVPGSPFCISS